MMIASAAFRDEKAAQQAIDKLVEEHFPAADISMRTADNRQEVQVANHQYFVPPVLIGTLLGAVIGLVLVLATPYGNGPFATDLRIVLGSTMFTGFLGAFAGLGYWRATADVPEKLTGHPFEVMVEVPEERVEHAVRSLEAAGGMRVRQRYHPVQPPQHAGDADSQPDAVTLPDAVTQP